MCCSENFASLWSYGSLMPEYIVIYKKYEILLKDYPLFAYGFAMVFQILN